MNVQIVLPQMSIISNREQDLTFQIVWPVGSVRIEFWDPSDADAFFHVVNDERHHPVISLQTSVELTPYGPYRTLVIRYYY